MTNWCNALQFAMGSAIMKSSKKVMQSMLCLQQIRRAHQEGEVYEKNPDYDDPDGAALGGGRSDPACMEAPCQ